MIPLHLAGNPMHMQHEGFYVVLNLPGFAEENPNLD